MHAISIPQKFQIDIFRKKKSLSYLCWIYKVLFPVLILSAKLCCRVLDCPRCDICPCSRCITLFKWNLLTPRIETVSTVFPPGVYILLCRGAFQLEMVNIHPCILHPPLSILYSFSVWSIGQILFKYQSNEIPLSLKICIFFMVNKHAQYDIFLGLCLGKRKEES